MREEDMTKKDPRVEPVRSHKTKKLGGQNGCLMLGSEAEEVEAQPLRKRGRGRVTSARRSWYSVTGSPHQLRLMASINYYFETVPYYVAPSILECTDIHLPLPPEYRD